MRFFSIILSAIALQHFQVSAAVVERADIEARDNVAACKAILIALKASAFCSSFVPITDVTSTVPGTTASAQATVTAACTPAPRKKRQLSTTRAISTTPAAPSTTRAISTTPAAPSTTRAISTTPAAPSTTAKATTTASTTPSKTTTAKTTTTSSNCNIKGVPPAISIFACQVIRDACLAFVKPKTKTVTGTVSTVTSYMTITPICSITTPSTTPVKTTTSTTSSTSSSTSSSSSSSSSSSTTPETTPPTTTPMTTPSTTASTTTSSSAAFVCGDNNLGTITVQCNDGSACDQPQQCNYASSYGQCAAICSDDPHCDYIYFDAPSNSCFTYDKCCPEDYS